MASFYILPPRECLEQALADFVGRVIPGLPVPATLSADLLERLAPDGSDVFLIHREDLPGCDAIAELVEGYGAEPGDAVAEVALAVGTRPAVVRRWQIPANVSAVGPAR